MYQLQVIQTNKHKVILQNEMKKSFAKKALDAVISRQYQFRDPMRIKQESKVAHFNLH